jgi:hypothetical protein
MVTPFQPDQPASHRRNQETREDIEYFSFHDMDLFP